MAHERNVEPALCVVQVLSYAKVFVSYIEPVCYFVCCHIILFILDFGCKVTYYFLNKVYKFLEIVHLSLDFIGERLLA